MSDDQEADNDDDCKDEDGMVRMMVIMIMDDVTLSYYRLQGCSGGD